MTSVLDNKLGVSTYTQSRKNEQGIIQYIRGIENKQQAIVRALDDDGSDYFFPEKDGKLSRLQFRPRNRSTALLGKAVIKETIEREVKDVQGVTVNFEFPETPNNLIQFFITFDVEQGQAADAFIYPFYLNNTNNQSS